MPAHLGGLRSDIRGMIERVCRRVGAGPPEAHEGEHLNDGVAILLSYGPDRDWLEEHHRLRWWPAERYGRTFEVADPHLVTKAEAAEHVTGLAGKVFPKIPFDNGAVLLRRV